MCSQRDEIPPNHPIVADHIYPKIKRVPGWPLGTLSMYV
jgi:hypothetical protein